jgi:hypothetical protein
LAIVFGFLVSPWKLRGSLRLIWADYWMIGIIASQSASEFASETLSTLAPVEQLRNYGLPYLIGRLCLQSPRDLGRMLSAVCLPMALLSCYSILEALLHVNVINRLIGQSWPLLETAEGFRWGLKRAQGNLGHPIYLGLMVAMMLPWLLEARHQSLRALGPYWWRFSPMLAIVAMVGTVSRAAQIATLFTLAADFVFRHPRWRVPLLFLGLVSAGVVVSFREEILEVLSRYAGEADKSQEKVSINGKLYEYSGTEHRRLLGLVYEDAIEKAPVLGYGSDTTLIPIDSQTDERFKSIDDQYLVYYLQYGPVGMFFFIGFATCICVYLIREAWRLNSYHAAFAGSLLGAFLGTTLIVNGVAMEADFGWIWLFIAGISAKLRVFGTRPDDMDYPRSTLQNSGKNFL